jgi:hypothetical protein
VHFADDEDGKSGGGGGSRVGWSVGGDDGSAGAGDIVGGGGGESVTAVLENARNLSPNGVENRYSLPIYQCHNMSHNMCLRDTRCVHSNICYLINLLTSRRGREFKSPHVSGGLSEWTSSHLHA